MEQFPFFFSYKNRLQKVESCYNVIEIFPHHFKQGLNGFNNIMISRLWFIFHCVPLKICCDS